MKWAFLYDEPKITDGLGIPPDRANKFVDIIRDEIQSSLSQEDIHVVQCMERLINRTQPRDQVEALMIGYSFGFNLVVNQMEAARMGQGMVSTLPPSDPKKQLRANKRAALIMLLIAFGIGFLLCMAIVS